MKTSITQDLLNRLFKLNLTQHTVYTCIHDAGLHATLEEAAWAVAADEPYVALFDSIIRNNYALVCLKLGIYYLYIKENIRAARNYLEIYLEKLERDTEFHEDIVDYAEAQNLLYYCMSLDDNVDKNKLVELIQEHLIDILVLELEHYAHFNSLNLARSFLTQLLTQVFNSSRLNQINTLENNSRDTELAEINSQSSSLIRRSDENRLFAPRRPAPINCQRSTHDVIHYSP
jgi:hypothetical protein